MENMFSASFWIEIIVDIFKSPFVPFFYFYEHNIFILIILVIIALLLFKTEVGEALACTILCGTGLLLQDHPILACFFIVGGIFDCLEKANAKWKEIRKKRNTSTGTKEIDDLFK